MKIQLADIEKIFTMLLTALNQLHVESVDIRIDYYWSVSGEDAYSFDNQKPECGVGSLVDDWECLKKVLDKQNPLTTVDIERLGSIIQAVGDSVYQQKIPPQQPLFLVNFNEVTTFLGLILQKARNAGINEVEIGVDSYWDIAPGDEYDLSKEPKIIRKSFVNDWEKLQGMRSAADTVSKISFELFGRLLKILGEEIDRSPRKINWLID